MSEPRRATSRVFPKGSLKSSWEGPARASQTWLSVRPAEPPTALTGAGAPGLVRPQVLGASPGRSWTRPAPAALLRDSCLASQLVPRPFPQTEAPRAPRSQSRSRAGTGLGAGLLVPRPVLLLLGQVGAFLGLGPHLRSGRCRLHPPSCVRLRRDPLGQVQGSGQLDPRAPTLSGTTSHRSTGTSCGDPGPGGVWPLHVATRPWVVPSN